MFKDSYLILIIGCKKFGKFLRSRYDRKTIMDARFFLQTNALAVHEPKEFSLFVAVLLHSEIISVQNQVREDVAG